MKVWFLDNGSIVIEHTQLMWNVPGPQVRIPVYSVLVEYDDGLVLFDTGIDLDHMNRVLPFELPEQTGEQTIPAQLETCGFSLEDVTLLVNSHLHIQLVRTPTIHNPERKLLHQVPLLRLTLTVNSGSSSPGTNNLRSSASASIRSSATL